MATQIGRLLPVRLVAPLLLPNLLRTPGQSCSASGDACSDHAQGARPHMPRPDWRPLRDRLLSDIDIRATVAPASEELRQAEDEPDFVDTVCHFGLYETLTQVEDFLLNLAGSLLYEGDLDLLNGRLDQDMQYWKVLGVVFVHIPRTGGTAVRQRLAPIAYRRGLHIEELTKRLAVEHLFASSFVRWRPETKDYSFFTVVRNPFARLFSGYRWLLTPDEQPEDCVHCLVSTQAIQRRGQNFSAFVEEGLSSVLHRINLFIPQVHFLQDPNTRDWIVPMSNALRFEDLQVSLFPALQKLGLVAQDATDVHAQHGLVMDPRRWCSSYTQAAVDTAAQLYAEDLSAFGYSFDCTADEMRNSQDEASVAPAGSYSFG